MVAERTNRSITHLIAGARPVASLEGGFCFDRAIIWIWIALFFRTDRTCQTVEHGPRLASAQCCLGAAGMYYTRASKDFVRLHGC